MAPSRGAADDGASPHGAADIVREIRHIRARGQGGFVLPELIVASLIVATLSSVAVPAYLDAADPSQDLVAKTALWNALEVARLALVDDTSTDVAGAAVPDAIDDTDLPAGISVADTADGWAAAVQSDSGTCFMVRLTTDGVAGYATTTVPEECTATFALAHATANTW